MANVLTSNPIYVDSTGSLGTTPMAITQITWAGATAAHTLVIKDNAGVIKVSLTCPTTNATIVVQFVNPIISHNGFNVTAIGGGHALLY